MGQTDLGSGHEESLEDKAASNRTGPFAVIIAAISCGALLAIAGAICLDAHSARRTRGLHLDLEANDSNTVEEDREALSPELAAPSSQSFLYSEPYYPAGTKIFLKPVHTATVISKAEAVFLGAMPLSTLAPSPRGEFARVPLDPVGVDSQLSLRSGACSAQRPYMAPPVPMPATMPQSFVEVDRMGGSVSDALQQESQAVHESQAVTSADAPLDVGKEEESSIACNNKKGGCC